MSSSHEKSSQQCARPKCVQEQSLNILNQNIEQLIDQNNRAEKREGELAELIFAERVASREAMDEFKRSHAETSRHLEDLASEMSSTMKALEGKIDGLSERVDGLESSQRSPNPPQKSKKFPKSIEDEQTELAATIGKKIIYFFMNMKVVAATLAGLVFIAAQYDKVAALCKRVFEAVTGTG